MTDRAAFLTRIAAEPADDTARLVYADWLDEQEAGQVLCPACGGEKRIKSFIGSETYIHNADGFTGDKPWRWFNCQHCSCTGTVPDTSDRDLAEFIRVGVELVAQFHPTDWQAQLDAGTLAADHPLERAMKSGRGLSNEALDKVNEYNERKSKLQSRESALLAAHPEWKACSCPECGGYGGIPGPGRCPTCGGTGDLLKGHYRYERETLDGVESVAETRPRPVTFARGFPDAVHCTLAELGGVCPECRGHGRHADHSEAECTDCGGKTGTGRCGTGFRPSPWAAAVVRATAVTRFVVTDRRPFRYLDDPTCCGWHRDRPTYNGDPREVLPPWLYDALPPGNVYPTPEAAHDALACGALIRRVVYGANMKEKKR